MSCIVSEDTRISGKWIQLISRSVDIKDQPVSQSTSQLVMWLMSLTDRIPSASQSVCPLHTRHTDSSQSVCLFLTDRLTFIINDLFRIRRYKNIRTIDSIYIAEYRYNGPVSQPADQSASQSVCPWQTDWLQPASQSDISFQKIQKYQENGFNYITVCWI